MDERRQRRHLPSQDWGTFGLAVHRGARCDVPVLARPTGVHADALRGIDGTPAREWDLERWRAALAPHLASRDPRVDGRARARSFSADRWPRASRRRGAALLAEGGLARRLYSPAGRTGRSRGASRHERTPAAHLPPGRRRGDPDASRSRSPMPARGSAPSPLNRRRRGRSSAVPRGRPTAEVVEQPRHRELPRPRQAAPPARFLRRARELAFRDVGGLIFDIRRREPRPPRARRGEARARWRRSTRSCARSSACSTTPPDPRAARAGASSLPALRRAARERRDLLPALRRAGRAAARGRGRREAAAARAAAPARDAAPSREAAPSRAARRGGEAGRSREAAPRRAEPAGATAPRPPDGNGRPAHGDGRDAGQATDAAADRARAGPRAGHRTSP